MVVRSIVFLPPNADTQWVLLCTQYCISRRYEIVAVVHAWADAVKLLADGRATVLVTGRRDHLPRDREPRLEVVTEQQDNTPTPLSRRRPVRLSANRRPSPRG